MPWGPFKDLALTVVKYATKASYRGKVVSHGFRGLVHCSRAEVAELITAVKRCPKDYSHHEGPRSKTREAGARARKPSKVHCQ